VVRATGDFGLELVAGEKGIAFRPGSVQANIAVTERPGTGLKSSSPSLKRWSCSIAKTSRRRPRISKLTEG
jgi:hypothetical protein